MERIRKAFHNNFTIVMAIAAKDIVDAIKNRTVISVLLGVTLMMLTAQAIPLLLKITATPRVIVFDPGDSSLIDTLRNADYFDVRVSGSVDELERQLGNLNAEVLGIVVPANLDRAGTAGERVKIQGYVMWTARAVAQELADELEQHLNGLLSYPISVETEGNIVFPEQESTSSIGMIAFTLVVVLATIGSFLVPYLIFEERQNHTLEVLLVSPASPGQIVVAKALAGLFLCLAAMGVAFAFNRSAIVHWEIAILTAIAGALLANMVGLLIGSIFESGQQISLWILFPGILLVIPVLMGVMGKQFPEPFNLFFSWMPTTALVQAFLFSFLGDVGLTSTLSNLLLVLGWTLPIAALVIAKVHRSDR